MATGNSGSYRGGFDAEKFNATLKTIWEKSPITIEFSYRDSDKNSVRRKARLEKIQEGRSGNLYFYCHDFARNESRNFKVLRITSKISAYNKTYSVDRFVSYLLSERVAGEQSPKEVDTSGVDAQPEIVEKVRYVEVPKEVIKTVEVVKRISVPVEVEVIKNVPVTRVSYLAAASLVGMLLGGTISYMWALEYFNAREEKIISSYETKIKLYQDLIKANPKMKSSSSRK